MENLRYLFAAYSIIFAALALYILFLWRRQATLDQRIRRLEAELDELRYQLTADRSESPSKTSRSKS